MNRIDVQRLQEIATVEFPDIVLDTIPGLNELRIICRMMQKLPCGKC